MDDMMTTWWRHDDDMMMTCMDPTCSRLTVITVRLRSKSWRFRRQSVWMVWSSMATPGVLWLIACVPWRIVSVNSTLTLHITALTPFPTQHVIKQSFQVRLSKISMVRICSHLQRASRKECQNPRYSLTLFVPSKSRVIASVMFHVEVQQRHVSA